MTTELLTAEAVSSILRVPRPTIYVWADKNRIPGVVRLGSAIRFRRDDIEAWVAACYRA